MDKRYVKEPVCVDYFAYWRSLREVSTDSTHVAAIDAAVRYLEKRDYSLKVDWKSVWTMHRRFP